MRLEGAMKGGFYACPPAVVDFACGFLKKLAGAEKVTLFDPCAGKGEAIAAIADSLQVPYGSVWACELEEGRSAQCKVRMPTACVLAPADYLRTDIQAKSLSFVWVNPPFDNEIGGGKRVESSFLMTTTRLLVPGGILALVCPEAVLSSNWDMREHLVQHYESLRVVPFPAEHRNYKEVITFGVRRKGHDKDRSGSDWLSTIAKQGLGVYHLPPSSGPRRFVKTGLTEREACRAMAASPLCRLFDKGEEVATPSPPLELGKGQLALVLAGGFLNTTLQKPGEEPILIKATPYKEEYISSQTSEVKNEGTDDEDVVTTTVKSERIKLKIRVMTPRGVIHELA